MPGSQETPVPPAAQGRLIHSRQRIAAVVGRHGNDPAEVAAKLCVSFAAAKRLIEEHIAAAKRTDDPEDKPEDKQVPDHHHDDGYWAKLGDVVLQIVEQVSSAQSERIIAEVGERFRLVERAAEEVAEIPSLAAPDTSPGQPAAGDDQRQDGDAPMPEIPAPDAADETGVAEPEPASQQQEPPASPNDAEPQAGGLPVEATSREEEYVRHAITDGRQVVNRFPPGTVSEQPARRAPFTNRPKSKWKFGVQQQGRGKA